MRRATSRRYLSKKIDDNDDIDKEGSFSPEQHPKEVKLDAKETIIGGRFFAEKQEEMIHS